jgi:hypothetical protein
VDDTGSNFVCEITTHAIHKKRGFLAHEDPLLLAGSYRYNSEKVIGYSNIESSLLLCLSRLVVD